MHQLKEKTFGDLAEKRYNQEMQLNTKMFEEKKAENNDFVQKREEVQTKFESNAELQKSIKEAEDLKEQIEISYVDLEMLLLEVKELEDTTVMLNNKKDAL